MEEGNDIWKPNTYVNHQFTVAVDLIDGSSDPLKAGLIKAIEHLDEKIVRPDEDLPTELAVRYKTFMKEAKAREKRHANDSVYAATVMQCKNKKRWRLATEILRLSYELNTAAREHT